MRPEKRRFSAPWYVIVIIVIGTVLGLGAVFHQSALRNDAVRFPAPGIIPQNGGGTHIYTAGGRTRDGQPSVLLLGGWGTAGPVEDYMPLMSKLRAEAKVIAVERPGYGYARKEFSKRTLDNMVEEMRAGLEELGDRGPYVVVAHTTAGLEAIHYAALYPEEVSGIVFINALSPGAYYYQPRKFLDYLKAYTYPIPKYTGIFRLIGVFGPETFVTGPDIDSEAYTAMFNKNVMSGAMRAELSMLRKNATTALLHGDLEVPSAAFVDSRPFNESNPELVRVWGDFFGNVAETDVGSYIHGFETDMVAAKILEMVR
ncbi:MAG: alpha/beta hydrolase [Oscillospiraceae bacterium]|nr:alpha/beta hydrolase [Oscillospiraceae bacterium]